MMVSPDGKKPICGDNIWSWVAGPCCCEKWNMASKSRMWHLACCYMVLENSTVMLLVYTWAGYSQTLGMGKKTLISKIVDNVFVTITVCADSYYECFYPSELLYSGP